MTHVHSSSATPRTAQAATGAEPPLASAPQFPDLLSPTGQTVTGLASGDGVRTPDRFRDDYDPDQYPDDRPTRAELERERHEEGEWWRWPQ